MGWDSKNGMRQQERDSRKRTARTVQPEWEGIARMRQLEQGKENRSGQPEQDS
jgi:hypothetical protein